MKTTQPPITNDQELDGYRIGAQQLRGMIDRDEQELMVERQRTPVDLQRLDNIRYHLHHLYGYYKGIQDAIDQYKRQKQTA